MFKPSILLICSYKEESGSYNTESDAASNLTWIVGTMGGPKSKTLDLLEHMLAALESYFLSANSGSHSWHLSYFCLLLSKKFVLRIHRERYRIQCGNRLQFHKNPFFAGTLENQTGDQSFRMNTK